MTDGVRIVEDYVINFYKVFFNDNSSSEDSFLYVSHVIPDLVAPEENSLLTSVPDFCRD